MKKYIFISLGSISASILLIIILYKNTDIPLVDELVESTTKAIGFKPAMVAEKETRRAQEEKPLIVTPKITDIPKDDQSEQEMLLAIAKKRKEDSLSRVVFIKDSLRMVALTVEKEKEAKRKSLFNAQIDEQAAAKAKADRELRDKRIADSIALASTVKPKKKLFNAQVDEKVKPTNATATDLSFIEAKVHGSQKFTDNGVVTFRLSRPTKLQGKDLPENLVFTTKANVFDGKVYFIFNSIENINHIKGENYTQGKEGRVITSEMKLGDSFILSDGELVTFGVKALN